MKYLPIPEQTSLEKQRLLDLAEDVVSRKIILDMSDYYTSDKNRVNPLTLDEVFQYEGNYCGTAACYLGGAPFVEKRCGRVFKETLWSMLAQELYGPCFERESGYWHFLSDSYWPNDKQQCANRTKALLDGKAPAEFHHYDILFDNNGDVIE